MEPKISFQTLDVERGIDSNLKGDLFPLQEWYENIKNQPIEELQVEDLCRACIQEIYLDYIIPQCLKYLELDINAGYLYEGQILSSLSQVPNSFYENKIEISRTIKKILTDQGDRIVPDSREFFDKLKIKISGILNT